MKILETSECLELTDMKLTGVDCSSISLALSEMPRLQFCLPGAQIDQPILEPNTEHGRALIYCNGVVSVSKEFPFLF